MEGEHAGVMAVGREPGGPAADHRAAGKSVWVNGVAATARGGARGRVE